MIGNISTIGFIVVMIASVGCMITGLWMLFSRKYKHDPRNPIRAYIDYQFKPLNKETCVMQMAILALLSCTPCLLGANGYWMALISVCIVVLVGAIMALICMKHSDRKSSKFLSNGMAFTYSSVILLLIGAVMERPSAIIGHAVLVFFLIWLAVEAVFLLIQNALVCRGAYLHGAGKVSAGLGAVGGMLGIASARVIGLLFSRGTILSVVILGFSALLGMVGTQYFLKIYYLKRFSLPDHI